MTWTLGETVRESFNSGSAGETFTRSVSRINGATSTFDLTFTDLGSGFYEYSYTPTTTGSFSWMGSGSTSGALTINFDVEAAATSSIVASGTAVITAPLNVAILDTLIVRDNADAAITGLTASDFTVIEAYDLSSPSTTATVTFTEIGNGEYGISFIPTTSSTWTAHLEYSAGGVFREFSQTYGVEAPIVSTTNIAVSGTTATRGDLRRRIADQLGDLVTLRATSASSSLGTFVDSLNINQGTENLNGRQLIFTNGDNFGHISRITGTSETTNTITIYPEATASIDLGATADVVNERGRGWTVEEYHRAIRNAIKDAYPLALSSVAYDYDPNDYSPAPSFGNDTLTVATPDQLIEVHTVEWQDTDSEWRFVPLAPNTYTPGWRPVPTTGQLEIRGYYGRWAQGNRLRVSGYARFEDNLATDTDATDLNEEWIVARSCFHLCRQAVDRDSSRANLVLLYKEDSERLRPRIRLVRKNGTKRVRGD